MILYKLLIMRALELHYFYCMVQVQFAQRVAAIVKDDTAITGLAVGGSWLTKEMDEFSDLDLILVTTKKVTDETSNMLAYARRFGQLLTGFTGDHVGEPRLLICLYNDPLLHVDIKFLTIDEFHSRIETPAILFDREGQLRDSIDKTAPHYPYPDYQWIEDRFWIWVHYALLKIGRGEYFEALDFFGFIRGRVLGPLLLIRNGSRPGGVRRIETKLAAEDLMALKRTLADDNKRSLLEALRHAVALYRDLRTSLFADAVHFQQATEAKVIEFMNDELFHI